MQKIILFLIVLMPLFSFGQQSSLDSNFIFWSKERRLQESDFHIKVGPISNSYSFAQYSFDYNLIGTFTFGIPKDYKKRIRIYFIKSASWLDTTYDVNISIQYQQTLFDLAEVYARQFRKSVYENRRKIAWGKIKIKELSSQALTNFSNRRVQYDTETNFGTITDKQKDWESAIEKELEELKEFFTD